MAVTTMSFCGSFNSYKMRQSPTRRRSVGEVLKLSVELTREFFALSNSIDRLLARRSNSQQADNVDVVKS